MDDTMASSGSFYQLPDELLVKIFTYLDIPDLVLNIQYVDSRWKAIIQDISFWRDYVFTFKEQMTDNVLLLQNMPALRAVVATRPVPNKVIRTLFQRNKCITYLELHDNQRFTVSHLETIVKNLPQIQHLAFPLSGTGSANAINYSTLIQQLPELLSLTLLGYASNIGHCYFLKGIATKCPLLHEVDLGIHNFFIEDVILFIEYKKEIISKFFAAAVNSAEILCLLGACKQLQALHFSFGEEIPSNIPLFEFPNLKHLGILHHGQERFSIIVQHLKESTMSNLVKLDLSSCNLNSEQFENILRKCMHLKSLILPYCFLLNGDDFQHIEKCIHLEHLDVRHTFINDAAVEVFSAKCVKLMHLEMDFSSTITDFSLQCLINCSELRTLSLCCTQITGQNFHLIPLHLSKLLELHIRDCDDLEFRYVQQLQEQMPHLQVHTTIEISEESVDLTGTNLFTEL